MFQNRVHFQTFPTKRILFLKEVDSFQKKVGPVLILKKWVLWKVSTLHALFPLVCYVLESLIYVSNQKPKDPEIFKKCQDPDTFMPQYLSILRFSYQKCQDPEIPCFQNVRILTFLIPYKNLRILTFLI